MSEENDRFDIVETKQCVDCQRDFDITKGEMSYFESNALTPPKRCKDCRRLKKMRAQEEGK